MSSNPLVTVLMPTYKGAKYLRETIDSVLSQTFKDFEFLIINDCSPDDTDEIIAKYDDPRIRYVKNEKNLGISGSSNYGFSIARGKYIARQDHDDISLPDRLQKQVDYLESHPETGLVGTGFRVFGSKSKTVIYPENDADIKALLLFKMPLAHQTSMMRKSVFVDNGLRYDESFASSNDRKLWIEAMDYMAFHNLSEPLLRYRMYKGMTSVTKRDRVLDEGKRMRDLLFAKLGVCFSAEEKEVINTYLMQGRAHLKDITVLEVIERVLQQLIMANRERQVFETGAFEKVCASYWFKRCLNCSFYGCRTTGAIYYNSPLSKIKTAAGAAQKAAFKILNGLFCWR